VGADQILVVEPARSADADFGYRIFNNTGDEVEHCGNGARCFVRYVRDQHLSERDTVRVQTLNRVLALHMAADGRVSVDMGAPVFELSALPFDASGLQARHTLGWSTWPLEVTAHGQQTILHTAVLSMGNPHAVQLVDNVDSAPVAEWGPQIESHPRFARHVNAGFMQLLSRTEMRLRVYERGAGETLACGTGACAAVVAGIRLGLLDSRVDVHTRGGLLTVDWPGSAGQLDAAVTLSGPATRVFDGEIEIPDA
jgi:diaminopimelate epimerase